MMLLGLLHFSKDMVAQYTPLICTVEVGLLTVIIIAIVRVVKYDKQLRRENKRRLDNTLMVTHCPDYWTMQDGPNGSKSCLRKYTSPDNKTTIKMRAKGGDKINLDDYDDRPMVDVCAKVGKLGAPWTDVRSVCKSFDIATSSHHRST